MTRRWTRGGLLLAIASYAASPASADVLYRNLKVACAGDKATLQMDCSDGQSHCHDTAEASTPLYGCKGGTPSAAQIGNITWTQWNCTCSCAWPDTGGASWACGTMHACDAGYSRCAVSAIGTIDTECAQLAMEDALCILPSTCRTGMGLDCVAFHAGGGDGGMTTLTDAAPPAQSDGSVTTTPPRASGCALGPVQASLGVGYGLVLVVALLLARRRR